MKLRIVKTFIFGCAMAGVLNISISTTCFAKEVASTSTMNTSSVAETVTDEEYKAASAYLTGNYFSLSDGKIMYFEGIDSNTMNALIKAFNSGYANYVLNSSGVYYRIANSDYTHIYAFNTRAEARNCDISNAIAVYTSKEISGDVIAKVSAADAAYLINVKKWAYAQNYGVSVTTIDNILSLIITDGMTDFDKVTAINNYLCSTISYDYSLQRNTCYDAIYNGKSVCQGYANAFYMLANSAGVETEFVIGTAGGAEHSFNRCLINGEYYYVDVTWNDAMNNAYLLMSYDVISATHTVNSINDMTYMY